MIESVPPNAAIFFWKVGRGNLIQWQLDLLCYWWDVEKKSLSETRQAFYILRKILII
jgi:hypothetical protein